jgi:hypothetical protein
MFMIQIDHQNDGRRYWLAEAVEQINAPFGYGISAKIVSRAIWDSKRTWQRKPGATIYSEVKFNGSFVVFTLP